MRAIMPTLAALALAALALAGCDPGLGTEEDYSVPPSEVGTVQIFSPEHRLPSSAKNVRIHRRHFQDTVLFVRFDAPPDDARAFAERLTGQKLRAGEGDVSSWGRGLGWWIDRYPEQGKGAVGTIGANATARVVVHPGTPDATVWIFASQG
ncbi:hypothetical protein TPR58_12405 [Sphingomonas sp. HF-S3]|uniref:Lipoprotein n=2 Tax=Sphingomonas rustica TaxID=3103142 RepID=A0ABV0B8S7_9SPHN